MNERLTGNDMQAIQSWWESKMGVERTPRSRFSRMMEEVIELDQEITKEEEGRGDYRAIADEAVDVLILSLALIDSCGYDVETIFAEKLARNHIKYNVTEALQLRQQGKTPEETLSILKKKWNERNTATDPTIEA